MLSQFLQTNTKKSLSMLTSLVVSLLLGAAPAIAQGAYDGTVIYPDDAGCYEISAEAGDTLVLSSDLTAIDSMQLSFNGSVSQTVCLSVSTQRPSALDSAPQGVTRIYLRVNGGELLNDTLQSARLNFMVERDWLDRNKVEDNAIELWHYVNGTWQQEASQVVAESGSTVYYQSTFDHFSYFAISGSPQGEVKSGTTGGTTTVGTTSGGGTTKGGLSSTGSNLALALGISIGVGSAWTFRRQLIGLVRHRVG